MADWRDFLDTDMGPSAKGLKTRDKAVFICSECQYRSVKLISNAILQIKRIDTHLCRRCSARRGTLNARAKYVKTLMDRYGVDNPMKIG